MIIYRFYIHFISALSVVKKVFKIEKEKIF